MSVDAGADRVVVVRFHCRRTTGYDCHEQDRANEGEKNGSHKFGSDKESRREVLAAVSVVSGKAPPELTPADLPALVHRYLIH